MEGAGNSIRRPIGYPTSLDESTSNNMVSNASSFSYSRFGNEDNYHPRQEIGWDQGDFSPKGNRPYMIRWKSGKKVDQRLMMLLESFFEDIYAKRKDFFKKIFPGEYQEFEKVFEKIEAMLKKNNNEVKDRTLQRSLSVGSPRLKLGRFKVKTPGVFLDVEAPDGGNTQEK